jgi:transcriptional regulator
MYLPDAFDERDEATLLQLIERFPFATLITPAPERLWISHVPLLARRAAHGVQLVGHLARANEHWRALRPDLTSTAIFHGPHAHVSPTWYEASPAVPTWNYAVVHVSGGVTVHEDAPTKAAAIAELTRLYEGTRDDAWTPERLPGDVAESLLGAIVAFEMVMQDVRGKFKLSQNRSVADRRGVIAHLRAQGSETAHELAAMMELALP